MNMKNKSYSRSRKIMFLLIKIIGIRSLGYENMSELNLCLLILLTSRATWWPFCTCLNLTCSLPCSLHLWQWEKTHISPDHMKNSSALLWMGYWIFAIIQTRPFHHTQQFQPSSRAMFIQCKPQERAVQTPDIRTCEALMMNTAIW